MAIPAFVIGLPVNDIGKTVVRPTRLRVEQKFKASFSAC
jgi:hypothetical protein